MRSRRGLGIALSLAAAAAVAAMFATTAQGARTPSTITFVVRNDGIEYLTSVGSTSVFPGRLQTGDRILSRDILLQRGRSVGYGDELCTVTFGSNELCQEALVWPGKGQLEASWLWNWPHPFSGVIDGGTGTFAHARGDFSATLLPNGEPRITATLR
jgi:hypothetical protein